MGKMKSIAIEMEERMKEYEAWNRHINNQETRQNEPLKIEELVDHPSHYTQGGIECIEAIKAALTPEEFQGYCKGNAIKYIWRERHKGHTESIKKAEWYIKEILRDAVTPR